MVLYAAGFGFKKLLIISAFSSSPGWYTFFSLPGDHRKQYGGSVIGRYKICKLYESLNRPSVLRTPAAYMKAMTGFSFRKPDELKKSLTLFTSAFRKILNSEGLPFMPRKDNRL